jgi:hypothetical protein
VFSRPAKIILFTLRVSRVIAECGKKNSGRKKKNVSWFFEFEFMIEIVDSP